MKRAASTWVRQEDVERLPECIPPRRCSQKPSDTMILIDAGRPSLAEAELRKVAAAHPDFFDAQRVLGRLLLDRAGNDKQKIDEALLHLEAAFRLNPDDLGTGMAASQILLSIGRTA